MNSVQLHLALTHVPVILSLVGLAMLIVSLLIKNSTLTKTSYIIITIAGVTALPVYFSGESTEEAIEHLPGISESMIERHENLAKIGMISIATAGLLALAALFSSRWFLVNRIFKVAVLLLSIISAGVMFQTAHTGGQIRHSELSTGLAVQNETPENGSQGNDNNQQENDED